MTIKPWTEAIREISDDAIVNSRDIREYMQAEIDELRAAQNICGNGAGCLHKEATIDELRAENERLRDALNKFSEAELLMKQSTPGNPK